MKSAEELESFILTKIQNFSPETAAIMIMEEFAEYAQQFKQPVEPQAIDEALDAVAKESGRKDFKEYLFDLLGSDGGYEKLRQIIRNACAMTEGKVPTDEMIERESLKGDLYDLVGRLEWIKGAKWMRDQLLPAPPQIDKEK